METGRETQFAAIFHCLVGSHDESTERRTQRQRVQQRYGNGSSHCQTELGIECSGRTADKADRDKYGHEHKGGSHQSRGNAVHRIDGRQIRGLVSLIKLGLHGLDHHYGIITTVPMTSTSAKRVSMFRLKPTRDRKANVPTRETMMDKAGMNVDRRLWRKI